jgi:hypothetical protein
MPGDLRLSVARSLELTRYIFGRSSSHLNDRRLRNSAIEKLYNRDEARDRNR